MFIFFIEVDPEPIKSFFVEVSHGNYGEVNKMLRSGMQVDICDTNGNTALHYGAKYKHTDVVRLLVRKGADVNKQNHQKRTPLHVASEYNSNEIIRALMQCDALTNIKDDRGYTPIDIARINKNKEAKSLLKKNKVSNF